MKVLENSVYNKIKNNKLFKKTDILVYAVLFLLVAVLFTVFVIFPKTAKSNLITASLNNKEIFRYNFADNTYTEYEFDGKIEITESENARFLKIFFGKDCKDFNTVCIDLKNKTVSVTESNCSIRKDCVHSTPITTNGGIIICMPHALKITCNGYRPVSTGGVL